MDYENPFTDCKQVTILRREEISTLRQQRPSSPPTFHIDFVFSCKPFIHKLVLNPQHSPNPRFEEALDLPEIKSFAYMTLDKFLLQEPAREIIQQCLKNWPVNKNWRTSFIDYVMLKAKDKIINMPCRHNSVCLKFEVTTIHEHVFDERAVEESIRIDQNHAEESIRIDQNHAEESIKISVDNMSEDGDDDDDSDDSDNDDDDDDDYDDEDDYYDDDDYFDDYYDYNDYNDDSMSDEDNWIEQDDDCNYMIPTLESSIESLETKVVMDDDTTCSICLEELSREGVSIGCSHIFHGDCIKTWLRNSHYCPVCRFELPIAS